MSSRAGTTGGTGGAPTGGTGVSDDIKNYRNFRSNPLERLGIENEDFKETLNQIAFTSPASYFKIRSAFSTYLLKNVVKLLHNTVYFALTSGIKVNQATAEPVEESFIATDVQDPSNPGFIGSFSVSQIQPHIPSETADKIAMDIVLTLKDSIQEDIIDRIFSTQQIDRAFATQARRAELEINTSDR
jgi:hypothetical protein